MEINVLSKLVNEEDLVDLPRWYHETPGVVQF